MNAPEALAEVRALTLATLPALGAELDGGLFAGLTTTPDGKHHAVCLLPDKPEGELTWQKALAWADEVGGVLPTRPVAALLFANCKDQFEATWHWSSEEHTNGASAWSQDFDTGYQDAGHELSELSARAVRRVAA
jgi:hypothetical protein